MRRRPAFALTWVVPFVLFVAAKSLLQTDEVGQHLSATLLPEWLLNTVRLALGVGVGVLLVGVSLAWLTALHHFPGRGWLEWGLVLPLAIPPYITAFVCIGLLDFAGPVQTSLRGWLGVDWMAHFPPIRSTGGVIVVMTLALYPYVYLLARNAFLTQGRHLMETAQALGCGRVRAFFRVVLPMARPWIASGVALALMETLSDFGTVSIFNYDTLTTAIYKAWFGFFSLETAAKLALLLIAVSLCVFLAASCSGTRHVQMGAARDHRAMLSGPWKWLACGYAFTLFAVAVLVPVGQLLVWAAHTFAEDLDARYARYVGHALLLGAASALLLASAALLLVFLRRRSPRLGVVVHFLSLGYALPGAVLAVGVFMALAAANAQFAQWTHALPNAAAPMLNGTLFALLLAYAIRFFAVAHGPVEGAMKRIPIHLEEAARGMGCGGLALVGKLYLPAMRGGVLTAALMVFVDVMKEMPMTLMMRPFGWDTLSTRIFEMTSEGQWERAALPALGLVLAGCLPVAFFAKMECRREGGP